MKQLLIFQSIVLFSVSALSLPNQRLQQFSISNHKGTIEIWSKETKQWIQLKDSSKLGIGSTIAVRENSELQITFEPAIFLTIQNNSILTLNNLIKQPENNIIRMSLTLQTGSVSLQMQSLASNTMLFSLETPSASINMNNTDAEIAVERNTTTLQVFRGEARLKHASAEVKSLVYEGSRATVHPNRPVMEITSAAEIIKTNKVKAKEPTIAILSIQSGKLNNSNVEKISDIVAENYQKSSNARVLFLDDIRSLLKAERLEGLLNCFTDSCITRISSIVGVDMLILGNVGQVGQSYVFSLKMIDALRDKTIKRISTSVDSNLGLVLHEIPKMVNELVTTQNELISAEERSNLDSSFSKYRENIVWIEGGSFTMGTSNKEEFDALPTHKVKLNGFYMDKYEVTKEEFEKVMGTNPSAIRGCPNCPVDNVTWFEASEYCRKVGKRLPTEAEWEYACRAGTSTLFHYGNTLSSEQANFDGKSPFGGVPQGISKSHPVPVGLYQPNNWGLYDMHGNVAEWCSDWYDPVYYGNSDEKNPTGPQGGKFKVVRGGSWNNEGKTLHSAKRTAYNPSIRLNTIGFRCVKDEY